MNAFYRQRSLVSTKKSVKEANNINSALRDGMGFHVPAECCVVWKPRGSYISTQLLVRLKGGFFDPIFKWKDYIKSWMQLILN